MSRKSIYNSFEEFKKKRDAGEDANYIDEDSTDIGYELGGRVRNNALPTRKIRKKHKKQYIFLKLLVFFGFAAGLYFFATSSFFTIEKITISTTPHFLEKDIETISGIKKGSNLFKTSMSDAKKRIARDPYTGIVRVSRKLPNEVKIVVKERKEFASISTKNRYVVIDKNGIALKTTSEAPQIPTINNIITKKIILGKQIIEKSNPKTDTLTLLEMLDFLKAMEESDMYYHKLQADGKLIKAWVYDDLAVVGTMENLKINLDEIKITIIDLDSRAIEKGTITVNNKRCSYSPEQEKK
jgi:cell division protein FtsQ